MTVRIAVAIQRFKELTRRENRYMSNPVVLYENPCDKCGTPLIRRKGVQIDEMVYMDMMGIYRCLRCSTPLSLAPIANVVIGQGNNELHVQGQLFVG